MQSPALILQVQTLYINEVPVFIKLKQELSEIPFAPESLWKMSWQSIFIAWHAVSLHYPWGGKRRVGGWG